MITPIEIVHAVTIVAGGILVLVWLNVFRLVIKDRRANRYQPKHRA